MKKALITLKIDDIQDKLIDLRGEKVLLDCDVADLYGVETKRVNEALANNPDKFPDGYVFDLNDSDWKALRSKFSALESIGKGKHTKFKPKAFTEKGLYMLATILKSRIATQTTLTIIETFAKIRKLSGNIKELAALTDKGKKQDLMQRSGELIAEILDDDLASKESETTIEINFAVLKFKHTIKKKK